MQDYLQEFYRPNSLVIGVAGNIDTARVIHQVERLFQDWEGHEHSTWTPSLPPQQTHPVSMLKRPTEQSNLCVGTLGISHPSEDYYAFMLLNAILGDGMSSRLFQTIREEQGLAYDIGSYFNSYYETGNLVVSAGVDPSKTEQAIRAIGKELTRLCDVPVTSTELERIKAYVCGGAILGMEGTQQVAYWLGSQECLRSDVMDLEDIIAKINVVTPQHIQRVAQTCFAPAWRRLAIIGPDDPQQAEHFGDLLKRV